MDGMSTDRVLLLLEDLAKTSKDSLLALDTAGEVVWAHPRLFAVLGRAPRPHIGFHLQDFFAGEDLRAFSRAMAALFCGDGAQLAGGLALRAGPARQPAEVVSATRLDFKDGASLVVGFLRVADEPRAAA